MAGLEFGKSAPLEIVPIKGKGQGVVARASISKGTYVTEYKYCKVHKTRKEMNLAEKDYVFNGEGCYIMEAWVGGKKQYLDATRRYSSYGRLKSFLIIWL